MSAVDPTVRGAAASSGPAPAVPAPVSPQAPASVRERVGRLVASRLPEGDSIREAA